MRIIRKEDITEPVKNGEGELFYEMIGRGEILGNAEKHSLGHVIVLSGHSTNKHYHPNSEEIYCFIKRKGQNGNTR